MAYYHSLAAHQPLTYLTPYSLPPIPSFPILPFTSAEGHPLQATPLAPGALQGYPYSPPEMRNARQKKQDTIIFDNNNFTYKFASTCLDLWSYEDVNRGDVVALPMSMENIEYRHDQLETLAARLFKDLRRINQNDPGKSKGKFINLLDTVLKLRRTLSDRNPNQSSLAEAEKLRKTLKNSSCILSVTTRINDNRVQLEKWDSMGRPKKVYLYFELYNLLHKYDKHRQTVKRIRPNNIYRANCKSDELTTKMNLLCLNPFHWECLMDKNEFTERMVNTVWTEDKGIHMRSICGLWAADIHKFVDWNENCSPEKYLDLVKMRVGCSETKDITQMMNMYCKKLKFLGVRKLDCIYYNEKTSIEKIREIERRLVKFCRPEVYEKFVVGNDIFSTDVETKFRWTCDEVKTSRICCNPDHVDSVHPNKDPFRLNSSGIFGFNAATSKLKKIMESKATTSSITNSQGHKIWCYLYFNRCKRKSR